jgi:hypothetical protein
MDQQHGSRNFGRFDLNEIFTTITAEHSEFQTSVVSGEHVMANFPPEDATWDRHPKRRIRGNHDAREPRPAAAEISFEIGLVLAAALCIALAGNLLASNWAVETSPPSFAEIGALHRAANLAMPLRAGENVPSIMAGHPHFAVGFSDRSQPFRAAARHILPEPRRIPYHTRAR